MRVFSLSGVSHFLEGEVTQSAMLLGFTLLCMLLIAAGVFYELEKFGVSALCGLCFFGGGSKCVCAAIACCDSMLGVAAILRDAR